MGKPSVSAKASHSLIGDGRRGLILVEAKAHGAELSPAGKLLGPGTNQANHDRIESAIAEANAGLNALLPGWNLRINTHYQLANRFAWAWKIAALGVPVVSMPALAATRGIHRRLVMEITVPEGQTALPAEEQWSDTYFDRAVQQAEDALSAGETNKALPEKGDGCRCGCKRKPFAALASDRCEQLLCQVTDLFRLALRRQKDIGVLLD